MTRVLITAFDPYDRWRQNASWLALIELTRELPARPQVVTRRYPVEFAAVREKLASDLSGGFDFALHLGQAPGAGVVRLEMFGVNIGGHSDECPDTFSPLEADGPAAYRSALPLGDWAASLRQEGIPAGVSYHAGTYLCNATLYWSHYFAERRGLPTRSTFIHLPLASSQVAESGENSASLPETIAAAAIRNILDFLDSAPRIA